MAKPRTMSEKTRAFLAIQGQVFPRVGDRGLFSEGFAGIDAEFSDDNERVVEVLRLSATGHTLWGRFVHPIGQQRFGEGRSIQRWGIQALDR